MQVADLLAEASIRIEKSLGLDKRVARLEARVLAAFIWEVAPSWLIAHDTDPLSPEHISRFCSALERRLEGEPIAYITGYREFYGREFHVTPDVLIPRPETELLVELALEYIPTQQPMQILDLGTGSGAIAVTLAKLRPQALITAVDVSPDALAIARQNAARLGTDNIRFIASDWFQALDPASQFDLIIANPPYIAANDPHLQQGDVRFEPLNALQSGADGLDAIRRIAQESRRFLTPNGHLMFEHGYNQQEACANILASFAYAHINCQRDLAKQPRVSSGKKS